MSIDLKQFHAVFFEEASEHLAAMEALLLDLDAGHAGADEMNAIFRAAHSIKGGAGTFGFADVATLTHELESLLDRLRKGELQLGAGMVDACLGAGDVIKDQLAAHAAGETADPAPAAAAAELLRSLARPSETLVAAPGAAPQRVHVEFTADTTKAPLDATLAELARLGRIEIASRPGGNGTSACAVTLLTGADNATIVDALAFVCAPGDICITRSSGTADKVPSTTPPYGLFDGAAGVPSAESSLTAEAYGFFDDAPGAPAAYGLFDGAPGTAPADDAGFGFFAGAPGAPDGGDASPAAGDPGFGFFAGAPGAPSEPAATPGDAPPAAPAPPRSGRRASDDPNVEAVVTGRRATDKIAVSAAGDAGSIRVSVEKVDLLMNMVGELVITQAMLAQAGHKLGIEHEMLAAGLGQLERNTRALQEAVMSIRMMPIAFVFNRFPRLVRELAGKLGKEVELTLLGESTEIDKGLIEKISDPLTHLVRNSLDHGVELPDEREAQGKPRQGSIRLEASQRAGNIVVEVSDDGAGLDRERILAKARERGMPVADNLSDTDVWQLIFEPGLSTAKEVSDLSGRGVGMDVVRRNIQQLGGRIEIESMKGVGTRMSIRLPLTLAILDGMSVAVGPEIFIVPVSYIVESIQPRAEDLRSVAGKGRVVHVRGEYLPVVAVHEALGIQPQRSDPASQGVLVVVEADGAKAALAVEELVGQHQVVIKSLESNYRKVAGISGATIMGDGRVALIVDVAGLIKLARQESGETLLAQASGWQ